MAVYCENKALGVIVTCVLLGAYGVCFLSTCFMWKMSADLHKTALEVEEDNNRALRNKRGSSMTKNDSESRKSVKSIEESSAVFEDFDYSTTQRAKKATQVILSINQEEEDDESLLLEHQGYTRVH